VSNLRLVSPDPATFSKRSRTDRSFDPTQVPPSKFRHYCCDAYSDARNLLVANRLATGGAFVRQESEVVEFIVVHGQFHQPVIINTGAIALARAKTESNGSKHLEIVMTSGIIVITDMTIEDLTKRLGASPA